MSNNKEEANPNFEHGVLYPIEELVDGVDVMLWRDKDSPYKAGLVRKDGDGYLLAASEYEANFYDAKYFTLYPKVKGHENIMSNSDVNNTPDNNSNPIGCAQDGDKDTEVMELVRRSKVIQTNYNMTGNSSHSLPKLLKECDETLQSQAAEIARLKGEVERLRSAFVPFLDATIEDCGGGPDDDDNFVDEEGVAIGHDGKSALTFGHIRKARQALKTNTQGGE